MRGNDGGSHRDAGAQEIGEGRGISGAELLAGVAGGQLSRRIILSRSIMQPIVQYVSIAAGAIGLSSLLRIYLGCPVV